MRQNSYSELLFLFSSQSISQAYRRLRYLKEFSDYRKRQAIEIIAIEEKVALQQQTLTQTRDAKEALRMQKEAESQKLKLEQQKENRTFLSLKGKEKNLHAQLSKQQRVANELNNKIEQLIAEEIRRSEERKREAARQAAAKQSKTPSHAVIATTPSVKTKESSVDFLTKEEQLVAGNFAANKGRLPWPVEKGFISGHFGIQPHPVLQHVTTNNKGIYIQTPRNADARVVFDGVVTERFSIPGSNNAIIVKHGNYRTVYANLTTIYVREGQHVNAKQKIGKIFSDDENGGKTELYLMIWQDKTPLNPEIWLVR
jgi:septal ring factor EnvC (AmiA/AmiB activator)